METIITSLIGCVMIAIAIFSVLMHIGARDRMVNAYLSAHLTSVNLMGQMMRGGSPRHVAHSRTCELIRREHVSPKTAAVLVALMDDTLAGIDVGPRQVTRALRKVGREFGRQS